MKLTSFTRNNTSGYGAVTDDGIVDLSSSIEGVSDLKTLLEAGNLAEAADYAAPTYWAGLRPMTPTGLPIIDRTDFDNLWLNTGHGHMGWTMACGSARITADLIGQQQTAIPREGMRFEGGQQR